MELTSQNRPLCIAEVPAPAGGLLGLTLCPGKRQTGAMSGNWHRDLEADLDAVHRWGCRAVASLVETWELVHLGVPRLGEGVAARGMAWYHLPIRDGDVPDAHFEQAWHRQGPDLRARLTAGEPILIHCRAGLVAARLLIEQGEDPAPRWTACAPPGRTPSSPPAQERYVLQQHWQHHPAR